jgi:hypothetical protein
MPGRPEIDRYSRLSGTRLYAVEISDWDCAQDFVVKRCNLVGNENIAKHVVLHQNVRERALLIVGLLETG